MEKQKFDFFFKILLLGESGIGKTDLLKRYTDNKFNPQSLVTIGFDYKIKIIQLQNFLIKLQIWDTGGCERFRNITKVYYKGADGIIFIFDITDEDSFKSIPNWIKIAKENYKENAEFIICANKCDKEERKKFNYEKFESIKDIKIFETSAITGKNVNEAFEYLTHQLLKKIFKKETLLIYLFNNELKFESNYIFNRGNNKVILNINFSNNYLSSIYSSGFIFCINISDKDSFEKIKNEINYINNYSYSFEDKSILITYQNNNNDKDKVISKRELDDFINDKKIIRFHVSSQEEITQVMNNFSHFLFQNNEKYYNSITKLKKEGPLIYLFKIPNIENILERKYIFMINNKAVTFNIISGLNFNIMKDINIKQFDGYIFFCYLAYKESFEYIDKAINFYKEFLVNCKSFIIAYEGGDNKEKILIDNELYKELQINIIKLSKKDEINNALQTLVYPTLLNIKESECPNIYLFKSPNDKQLLKNKYIFNINEKDYSFNIINFSNNDWINSTTLNNFYGFIFFFDILNKESFEYILIILNICKKYISNEKNIILAYNRDKDKKNQISEKELIDLYNIEKINIFKIFNENGINELLYFSIINIWIKELKKEKLLIYIFRFNHYEYNNLFENGYTFNINGKIISVHFINNNCQYFLNDINIKELDGFIYLLDKYNKESIEYIINQINNYKEYSLNKKSIILEYQKEIINEFNKEIYNLYDLAYDKEIQIFNISEKNNINNAIESLSRLIILGEIKILGNKFNELNKYIDF